MLFFKTRCSLSRSREGRKLDIIQKKFRKQKRSIFHIYDIVKMKNFTTTVVRQFVFHLNQIYFCETVSEECFYKFSGKNDEFVCNLPNSHDKKCYERYCAIFHADFGQILTRNQQVTICSKLVCSRLEYVCACFISQKKMYFRLPNPNNSFTSDGQVEEL